MRAAGLAVFGLAMLLNGLPAAAQDVGPGGDSASLTDYRHPDPRERPPNVAYHPSGDDPYDAVAGYDTYKDRPCRPGDRTCVDTVSAKLWREHPRQMAALCEREVVVRNDQDFDARQLHIADPAASLRHPTPQTQTLCQYGVTHGYSR